MSAHLWFTMRTTKKNSDLAWEPLLLPMVSLSAFFRLHTRNTFPHLLVSRFFALYVRGKDVNLSLRLFLNIGTSGDMYTYILLLIVVPASCKIACYSAFSLHSRALRISLHSILSAMLSDPFHRCNTFLFLLELSPFQI